MGYVLAIGRRWDPERGRSAAALEKKRKKKTSTGYTLLGLEHPRPERCPASGAGEKSKEIVFFPTYRQVVGCNPPGM